MWSDDWNRTNPWPDWFEQIHINLFQIMLKIRNWFNFRDYMFMYAMFGLVVPLGS